jgi:flagellar basal body-associated protein FliL
MYQQKKPRDYRSIWIVSMVLLVLGIVLTINLAIIRPVGFVLLGVGGIGLVLSLSNMDKWKDKKNKDEPRHFN